MGKEKIRFEEYLDKYGDLTYTNVGVSMLPMLRQHRDLIVIGKKTGRCKKFDVGLYIRPPHDYVLHRIVDVTDTGYTFLGDNCLNKEYNIREEQVIGVLKAFVRDGKKISVDDKLYQAYARLNYFFYPLRRVRIKTRARLGRLKRQVKKALRKGSVGKAKRQVKRTPGKGKK